MFNARLGLPRHTGLWYQADLAGFREGYSSAAETTLPSGKSPASTRALSFIKSD